MAEPTTALLEPPEGALGGSLEYRWLRDIVRIEFRRAFAGGVIVSREDAIPDDRAVVEISSTRALVLAGSLRAMAASLEVGADAVVPTALAASGLLVGRPVRSLRAFERVEAQWLLRPPPDPGFPLPPIVLWSPDGWRGRVGEGRPAAASRVACTGLYHEFVDYYGECRDDVLPYVAEGVREVLDIGCGRGLTGDMLRRERGCRVTGLDVNPVALHEAAGRLDGVIAGDVEVTDLGGPWDCILALELLEHLVDPVPFLERARAALRPGGSLVMSTPNVGHWSVVRDLLAGRWDYLPVGLLCTSHVRFWTRRTLENLLEMAHCEQFTIEPQLAEGADEIADLGSRLELDLDSLRTTGFWVIVRA